MTGPEEKAVIQAEGPDVEQAVKAERAKAREKIRSVSNDLTYFGNKLRHAYNAMALCTNAFDEDKPENRFSLSTFAPVVREIVDELEETRDELWERG